MVAHGAEMAGMDMDMGGHDMGGSTSSHTGMAMAFFTATNTPLYSEAWTPQNAGQYAGTCIFLIILAITLRGIFTAKSFLEAKALETAMKRRYVVVAGEKAVAEQANDANSMTGILTTNGMQEDVRIVSAPVRLVQPWRFSVDLPRAALMMVATGVGYLLMLAVMTFNVGYFLSILAGTFIGELALGRFNQANMAM
ncbi:Ctr copper transporter-like protein [Boeremia exigua]|uniref:Ctr copper transporter-like protein n=1 Tax=Boeremia exigua TaxID=749465 RepID=UPI001E8E64B4|nr:Ctr copper transporter-like protein [Boeremia exigua]KAH6618658.1 Ctr copper transporter-like protein [Boeremia exigua]